jgi:ATP-binding cassette subfamily B protein
VEHAAELASPPFISKLPRGYDTPVGERGIGLRAAKARIALARALLVDPRILILDEATSSVDTETEYLIQEGLDEVMKGRTSIIIAKRLSTIRGADKIVIMDQGESPWSHSRGTPRAAGFSGGCSRASSRTGRGPGPRARAGAGEGD